MLWRQKHCREPNKDKDLVFDLSQDPNYACVWTTKQGAIPTFRRNSRLWIPRRQRFLLPSEAAKLMGFPDTSFKFTQASIGNAMSLQTVGLIIVTALVSATKTRQESGK